MPDWSIQQVQQLAPDAAALQAAQGLAKPGKWQNLGHSERLVWGECQGSGATPYQVRIDSQDVVYKCSCPSRKQPCKHTLGLMLLMIDDAVQSTAVMPKFVTEWADTRAKLTAAKQDNEATASDPQAQARRSEKREARVLAGIEQLEAWLTDMIGQGLAAARSQPLSFWSQMAARQVDAQAPGLARRVRALSDLASGSQWQSQLLTGLARLQLLLDAYRSVDRLPSALATEVRQLIGWTQDQDGVRARAGVRDHWSVLARRQGEEEQLRVQRTWLHGQQSQRFALVLEFAVGNQPLPATFVTGQCIDAEFAYFESVPELRALEKIRHPTVQTRIVPPRLLDAATLQVEHAARLAGNPWLERWPVMVGPVMPVMSVEQASLEDASGRRIRLAAHFCHGWNLVALAGSEPLAVFGEWDGESLDPMTVHWRERWFTLVQLGELPLLSRVA